MKKKLIVSFLSLLFMSTSIFADSSQEDIGDFRDISFVVEINESSPDSIKYNFKLIDASDDCLISPIYLLLNLAAAQIGCAFRKTTYSFNPEDFTLDFSNSSALKEGTIQKLRVNISHLYSTGSAYDIKVTIIEGPQDEIHKSTNILSGNHTFTLKNPTAIAEENIYDSEGDDDDDDDYDDNYSTVTEE